MWDHKAIQLSNKQTKLDNGVVSPPPLLVWRKTKPMWTLSLQLSWGSTEHFSVFKALFWLLRLCTACFHSLYEYRLMGNALFCSGSLTQDKQKHINHIKHTFLDVISIKYILTCYYTLNIIHEHVWMVYEMMQRCPLWWLMCSCVTKLHVLGFCTLLSTLLPSIVWISQHKSDPTPLLSHSYVFFYLCWYDLGEMCFLSAFV